MKKERRKLLNLRPPFGVNKSLLFVFLSVSLMVFNFLFFSILVGYFYPIENHLRNHFGDSFVARIEIFALTFGGLSRIYGFSSLPTISKANATRFPKSRFIYMGRASL